MSEISTLRCLTSKYLTELERNLDSIEIDELYGGDSVTLDLEQTLPTPIKRVGPPPNLLEEDGTTAPEHDAKNAILLHKHLPRMSSAQAADARIWAFLSHTDFHRYSKARWPLKRGKDLAQHVRDRWFMRGGRTGLLLNAVARLWWAAHLTYAPWERDEFLVPLRKAHSDDYIYTRWLFNNSNMFQAVVSRRFGSSMRVRICMLEAFHRRARNCSNLSSLSASVARRLNLVCSYRVLSSLSFPSLMRLMEEHVENAMHG